MRRFRHVVWLAGMAGGSGVLALAQGTARVCLQDAQGAPIPGVAAGGGYPASGPDGCFVVTKLPSSGVIRAKGFGEGRFQVDRPGQTQTIRLQPAEVTQTVTVTADRGLVGVDDRSTTVAVLSPAQLKAAPGLSLDDRLRQVAGFQLFRRTSSWTANPTTEGVSLRGLGSTAASRTLVESDQVPLNDPFGGWIHWNEVPQLAIAGVELVEGGSANLYGSSAIGGVIAVEPVAAVEGEPLRVEADALGATENTGVGDLLVLAAGRPGSVLLAGSGITTGGYIATAPAFRGPVDVQSNVSQQSGRVELRSPARTDGATVFLRGNVLNEARGNGTPLQTNGTRLWRYVGGAEGTSGAGHGSVRVFGSRETYRQSFSSISTNRTSEQLTRLQRVPTDEFGLAAAGSRELGEHLSAALGVDMRDIRATDAESPVTGGVVRDPTAISARQREVGGYAEAIWQRGGWSAAGSVRVDSFRTFDGRQVSPGGATLAQPEVKELVASPHAGLTRQLGHGYALTANAFRAFRGPTMNELYRTGQVGQQTTLANPNLLAERATGFELGGEAAAMRFRARELGRLRASYFWTEVNRPISAVLLSQTGTAQTLQRQNLGQIRSRGLSLQAETATWQGLQLTLGYQLAVATVTAFRSGSAAQADLTGNWIPQVPRHVAVGTLHWSRPRWADVTAIGTYSGRQYDDAANQFVLHPFARVDVSAERRLWGGLSLYAGAQNLLDRAIEAGRTPVLTLAAPRLVIAGLRWNLPR